MDELMGELLLHLQGTDSVHTKSSGTMLRRVLSPGMLAVSIAGLVGCGGPPPFLEGTVLEGKVEYRPARGQEKPVREASVQIWQDGAMAQQAPTNAEGRFQITNLPRGEFNLKVESKDYAPYDYEAATGILLNMENRRSEYVPIAVGGRLTIIAGKLLSEKDDEPVGKIKVTTSPLTVETESREDGTFEIRTSEVEPGVPYQIVTQASGTFEAYRTTSFDVEPGTETDLGTIQLETRPDPTKVENKEPQRENDDPGELHPDN
jgi:hypothetical protein